MKREINVFARTIVVLLMTVGCLHAQEKDISILNRYIKIDQRFKAGTWEAVHYLADKGIPIGFEATEHWNIDTDPRVVLKSGTLEEILDSIARQDEFYTWVEVDGVINVFPVMDRNKKSVLFLDTRIGPILINKGDNRASVVEMVSKLFDNGERKELRFHSAIGAGNHLGLPDKFEEQLNIAPSDMRTVLNKIIKVQQYSPIWSIVKYTNQNELTLVF